MIADLRAIVGGKITEDIIIPEETRFTPAGIKLLCTYLREANPTEEFKTTFFVAFIPDIAQAMGFMNVVSFFQCADLLKITQIKFVEHYIKGKTPATCLEAMGLPGNTVFSLEERTRVKTTFPFLCLKHLGGPVAADL